MRTDTIITFYDNFLNDELPVTFPGMTKAEALAECMESKYGSYLGKVLKIEEIQVYSFWDRIKKIIKSLQGKIK